MFQLNPMDQKLPSAVAVSNGLRRRLGMMDRGHVEDGDPQVIACHYGGLRDTVGSVAGALDLRPDQR
jgi:hypothetical protein